MSINTNNFKMWFARWVGWRFAQPITLPCGQHRMAAWEHDFLTGTVGIAAGDIPCDHCG